MQGLRFASVCDGIGCGRLGFERAGFDTAWTAEIEAFPNAVTSLRFAPRRNIGNMKKAVGKIRRGHVEAPDVLIGGTPCQAFSVAGQRKGLEDERGNLSLEFCRVADAIDAVRLAAGKSPAVILWENVPGVLSDKGNAFGCFLGELAGSGCQLQPPGGRWRNAGCVFGPLRTVAWRVLDSQFFGVAQRRRRVFVVAGAGDFRPEQVLFERGGVRRDSPPSREKGQGVTHDLAPCLGASGRGFERTGDTRGQDAVVACHTTGDGYWREGFGTLRAREQDSHENLLCMTHSVPDVCGCLSDGAHNGGGLNGQDAYTGRILPVYMAHGQANAEMALNQAPTLNCNHEAPIVIQDVRDIEKRQNGKGFSTAGVTYTLDAVAAQAIVTTLELRGRRDGLDLETRSDGTANCLRGPNGGRAGIGVGAVAYGWQVRRLTPEECETLQGLPRDWTRIPWRGKPAEECPDGPRYKAVGNGQTVQVMEWLARRIMRSFDK